MNGLPGQLRKIASRGRMDDADVQVLFDAADMIVNQAFDLAELKADFGRIVSIIDAHNSVSQPWGPGSPGYDEMGQ